MTELILTEEEKAQSFLEMEDEALGKYCKAIMCKLRENAEMGNAVNCNGRHAGRPINSGKINIFRI